MAIILRDVTAEVVDFEFEKIPPGNPQRLMIRGQISKQIIYGANKGIVHYQDAIDPFETVIELPEITAQSELNVRAEVEHISPRLNDDGIQVDQQIILKVYIKNDELLPEQTQNFLIRSVNYLEDIPHLENVPEEETKLDSTEPKRAFQKVKVKARLPELEPKIIPIPDVSLIINEKIEELEGLLHDELEESLRLKLHNELENSLRLKIHDEVVDSVQQRLRNELEDSIYYRLRNEFDAKLEVQLAEERKRIKDELRQQELVERSRYYEELRKKSIQQQRNGYRVKG